MNDTQHRGEGRQWLFVGFLIITAAVCGGLVMVVEVMGSRVVGPFYGVSLFVWTSLITVTLVALAAGYAAGGILSDRKESPDWLYGIILLSGVLVLFIPFLKAPVLKGCLPLGLRSGALVSSAVLFGPSLFLLGCVSPYIIKIAAREMRNIGRTVGLFYAVSTVGSFLGTVLTGFVLIAYLGVSRIFLLSGAVLVLLAVIYFIVFRRRWAALAFLFLPLLFSHETRTKETLMPDGTKASVVFEKESFYGNLKVVDYSFGSNHTRELIIDGLVQGGIDMRNGLSIYEYSYFMGSIPYALNPEGRSCLVIGLGPGVVPVWYEKRGIRTDIVDIDPNVVDIAREYFGFRISGDVIVSDARYYLLNSKKTYDFIVLDVFNGDTTPGHVLSVEALRMVRERMTPKGILAVNMVGSLRKETFMTASVIKTIGTVFQTVLVYPTFLPGEKDGAGNLAVIAYDYPEIAFDRAKVINLDVHPLARDMVSRQMREKFVLPADLPAIVLSDDYNPIDFYDSWLKERVRRDILENTSLEILI